MHILKIIHGYPLRYNAGSEVYSQSVVNELAKSHKVTVFTREENEYEPDFRFRYESKEGIDLVFVNMARGKDGYNHPLLNERFSALIRKIRPDIAHIGHLNHLSTGIVDVLHQAGIPMLYTLHDFWLMCPRGQFLQRNFDGSNLYRLCNGQEDRKCAETCYRMYHSGTENEQDLQYWTGWIHTRMETIRNITKKINLFHAPSRYLCNRFIRDFGLPAEKVVYLDYGFPSHYLTPVEPKTNGIYTFGYIGTHIPAKGVNLLIRAFSRIRGKAMLRIYGRKQGQNTEALKKLAEQSHNPVHFCGEYINHNLATTVFNKINCIVVPSIWAENSPLVIHEAQACRIPVITADYGGMKEYVSHRVNGLLFKHRDEESLFWQMEYAIEHPQKMKEYGKRGYLYTEDGTVPGIEEHCLRLTELYQSLIKR